tara:strand:+ start:1887 stop:2585 length:699 start_codon:yes stop_codon:yes gene_type:complete
MLCINNILFFAQVFVVSGMCLLCRSFGLAAMVSWLCLQSILANLLVLKMVTLFGLDVTVSDAFMIGSLFSLNLIREDYGRAACQQAILTSLFCLVVTILLFWLHMAFTPSTSDQMSQHYQHIFSAVLPIMLVSGCVFTFVQIFDYYLFGYLKSTMGQDNLTWRLFISLASSQVLDTALFTYWALGSWVASFISVFFWSYALKVMITIILSLSARLRLSTGELFTRFSRYVQI